MQIFKEDGDQKSLIEKLVERLSNEYGIIQQKIDNIGDFKFKVRGWLITIYSAFLFSIFSAQLPIHLCIPVGLFIIFIFFYLEREQLILQHKLSNRAKKIEKAIHFLSYKFYEKDLANADLKLKAILHDIDTSPRIAVEIIASEGSQQKSKVKKNSKNKSSKSIKHLLKSTWHSYWLFIVLTLLTIFIFISTKNDWIVKHFPLIKERDPQEKSITTTNNFLNKSLNYIPMRETSEIEQVEDEMLSLVSQIDFGDISDIDTYWDSLNEALLELPDECWTNLKPSNVELSTIVGSLKVSNATKLCQLTQKMKELCNTGSNSSVNEVDLRRLKRYASEYEKEFDKSLNELDGLVKEK